MGKGVYLPGTANNLRLNLDETNRHIMHSLKVCGLPMLLLSSVWFSHGQWRYHWHEAGVHPTNRVVCLQSQHWVEEKKWCGHHADVSGLGATGKELTTGWSRNHDPVCLGAEANDLLPPNLLHMRRPLPTRWQRRSRNMIASWLLKWSKLSSWS